MSTDVMSLADRVVDATKVYVQRLLASFGDRMAALERRLDAIPQPVKGDPGKDAEVDYDRIGDMIVLGIDKALGNAVANMPQPKNGDPGKDGVVDYALIKEFVAAAAVNALAALPKPKDGESVTLEDVEPMIAKAVAALPKPERGAPGKSVEVSEVEAMVARAVAARPMPVPGIPDAAAVEAMVAQHVKNAVAGLPPAEPGKPGKDADEAAIVASVLASVTKTLPTLIPPAPTVDEAAIAARVKDALPAIEQKPVELPDFDAIVDASVARSIAALPKPKDGESVHPDTVARMVAETVEKALAKVQMPKDGEPGRDAAELDILPGIDPERSYPEGTFALHDGGTLVAARATSPLATAASALEAGWRVAQDGIKALRAEPIDDLTHRLVVERTSGKVDTFEFKTSFANMDKGVHRPGMRYAAGSAVTKDESYWIARADTDATPPHPDWRLILKGKSRR